MCSWSLSQELCVFLPSVDGALYKYSRYFENPRFVGSAPGNSDGTVSQYHVPDEWEMYNLDADPYEQDNLLAPCCINKSDKAVVDTLGNALKAQRLQKRKIPNSTLSYLSI